MIQIKRAYDRVKNSDGCRILVDRLWPRGISKKDLQANYWLKKIAPSDELRKWFNHEPEKFDGFAQQYRAELKDKNKLLQKLLDICQKHATVTLVYAAKDQDHNNAVVLKEYLEQRLS